MILSPEVLTIFILNTIFAIFATIAFMLSIRIFLKWNVNSSSQLQYTLEKQSFLSATIIKYIFIIKIPLFLFFIFTLDKLSNVLTGAMCGAGVLDATSSGTYLIVLKIINLYMFAYWLKLNSQDMLDEMQSYTKLKFGIFIVLFLFFMFELFLEGYMFSSFEVDKMVSCCGSLYSSSSESSISKIFLLKSSYLLTLFYGNFLLIFIFYFLKNRYIFALLNFTFIIISLITLITFFGTYIYELPSHHCPFCFLQSEYYYIGYLIYLMLFVGTFYGLCVGFIKELQNCYTISLLFNFLYVIFLSSIAVIYYIKNGVWL